MVLLCVWYCYTVNGRKWKKIKKNLKSSFPQLVYVGPRTVHTIINKNKEEAIIIAYTSKEFDPDDPDTITKVIN